VVDRTVVATGTAAAVAEIAALRQKLAAAAARIQVEIGRHVRSRSMRSLSPRWTAAAMSPRLIAP
jgi:hypothetical protein